MAITSETVSRSQARREQLRALSDAQVVALVAAWVTLYDDLAPSYEAAVLSIAADYPGGATASQLAADRRVIDAVDITRTRVGELVDRLSEDHAETVATVTRMGADAPVEDLLAQLPPEVRASAQQGVGAGAAAMVTGQVQVRFGTVSDDALAAMVSRTTGRIHALSQPLTSEMEDAVKRHLTRGIVDGASPREVARKALADLEGEFNGGMARASRISRTEMLDAYRAADKATADENADLIAAQVWHATLDARTCMACLEQHGQDFPPDAEGPQDHPQGRCTFITRLKTWEELGFGPGIPEPEDAMPDAEAWFNGLTADTQRQMLGPGRYELWQSGKVSWGDFSVRRDNPDWRPAHYERSVSDLRRMAGG